ncbi:MAG: hypothetical protein ACYTFY_17895 [Planctomycetota bacterium]|jgi:hypothetical protein
MSYKIYNNSLLFIILSASLLLTGCSLLLPEHDMEFEKEIPHTACLEKRLLKNSGGRNMAR